MPWMENTFSGDECCTERLNVPVYPLRQAPICGVVILDNGEILPYGGFASLIPEHQWAWDSGEVKAAIQKVNSLQIT